MTGELFTDDLRRNSVTWKFIDLAAIANPEAFTLEEINSTNERLVFDPTCALEEEGSTFSVGSSEMNESMTYCDQAGISRPTQINPEIALSIRRDKDRNANGVYNNTLNWVRHVDTSFYVLQRVGDQGTGPREGQPAKVFEATDDIRLMQVRLDNPQDALSQGANALLSVTVLPAGFLAWNVNPVA